MSEKLMKKSRVLIAALLGTVMIAALTIWGCGTSSYDDPAAGANITTTRTPALIDVATLKEWVDAGKVNAPLTSYDRVVILSVSNTSTGVNPYTTSHIPGSQLWDGATQLGYTRIEAAAEISSMVPDGASMDALIQRFGINKYTTVVFTGSGTTNLMNATRAYFTFRYWGFPKERLKILNGGDSAWATAVAADISDTVNPDIWRSSDALTATVPTVTPSTYSVRNNYTGNFSSFGLRASIGQMISLVDNVTTADITSASGVAIIDARGVSGGTPYNTVHVKYALYDDFLNYMDPATGNRTFINTTIDPTTKAINTTALKTYLATLSNTPLAYTSGVTENKRMTYVYCASGFRASVPFFVLDGILGWPVTLYDGSSNQWLGYNGANLTTDSIWRVDNALRSEGTVGFTNAMPIYNNSYLNFMSVLDPEANQMLKADKIYFSTPPVSTSNGGGTAGGGSGC